MAHATHWQRNINKDSVIGNIPYSYAHAILTLKEILLSLTTGTGSRVSVRRWSPCC